MAYRWTATDLMGTRAGRENSVDVVGVVGLEKPKRPKYGNRKVTGVDGKVHDSGKEHRRWQELQFREIAGEISNLRHHVLLACVVNGEHICDYEADFMYDEGAAVIVEDTKPKDRKFRKTPAYRLFRLKQKLVQALYGIQIREV